jgi:hypothetical protein
MTPIAKRKRSATAPCHTPERPRAPQKSHSGPSMVLSQEQRANSQRLMKISVPMPTRRARIPAPIVPTTAPAVNTTIGSDAEKVSTPNCSLRNWTSSNGYCGSVLAPQ